MGTYFILAMKVHCFDNSAESLFIFLFIIKPQDILYQSNMR
jgi:hypothetical protein